MGGKSINVNFTVHKVEQLNLKERGHAGAYKTLERKWSVGFGALPPNTSQVHILHFSCLFWFIADFLFWWGHDDFNHEFKNPPKSILLGQTPHGHCSNCRKLARRWAQSWSGWLERFCLWRSLYIIFFHYKITALMREWLFPSSPCSAFFCHNFL